MQYKIHELLSNGTSYVWSLNSGADCCGSVDAGIASSGELWMRNGNRVSITPTISNLFCINDDPGIAVGVREWSQDSLRRAIMVPRGGTAAIDLETLVRNKPLPTNPLARALALLARHADLQDVGAGSLATGINNIGLICGYNGNHTSFVFNVSSSKVVSRIRPPVGFDWALAQGINSARHVCGFMTVAGQYDGAAFLYDGVVHNLGSARVVTGMNNKNDVVGGYVGTASQKNVPVIWRSGATIEPALPAGFQGGHGLSINDSGFVVGSCWPNDDGTVESYQELGTADQTAFVFDGAQSYDLNTLVQNDPGSWRLHAALGINQRGQIVGWGAHAGRLTSFLASPV
jgi:hypothetical protein